MANEQRFLSTVISVVIPVHNEEDTIERLLDEILSVMSDARYAYEIVVTDDGSSDDTWTILQNAAQANSVLRVIRHKKCCGQSRALLSGVRQSNGELIVTLDGDGQNDPADIPSMIDEFTSNPGEHSVEMVIGNRVQRQDSWWRRRCSRTAFRIRRFVLGDQTPDTGCGLKVFPKGVFLELPYFDHMHRFLPALVRRHGGHVLSVPVNHRPRLAGKSKYGTWDRLSAGVVDLFGVVWLLRRSVLPEMEDGLNEIRRDVVGNRDARSIPLHSSIRRSVA